VSVRYLSPTLGHILTGTIIAIQREPSSMPQDPISNREYEDSLEGFKLWADTEFPHGLPFLYAGVGFVTIGLLFSLVAVVASWLTGISIPNWGWVAISTLSLLWAHGGWIHGQDARDDLDTDTPTWEPRY
jgi:hypothetical protein